MNEKINKYNILFYRAGLQDVTSCDMYGATLAAANSAAAYARFRPGGATSGFMLPTAAHHHHAASTSFGTSPGYHHPSMYGAGFSGSAAPPSAFASTFYHGRGFDASGRAIDVQAR